MKFNINDYVRVKLTDLGRYIYYHQYDELNKIYGKQVCEPSYPKEVDGWYRAQLWSIMELFGPHIGMGKLNVFETIIEIEVEDDQE